MSYEGIECLESGKREFRQHNALVFFREKRKNIGKSRIIMSNILERRKNIKSILLFQ